MKEQKKSELKASLHVKKGQPLPDCPFRLKVTGKTNVDVIVGDEAVTKKVQKKELRKSWIRTFTKDCHRF